MKHGWSQAFSVWRERGGVREITRRSFLAVFILLIMPVGLFAHLMPSAKAEHHQVILALSAFLLALMPLAWVRVAGLFTGLLHLITLVALGMVMYIAAQSGGIHSSAVVWLSILAMPVMMLRGSRAALLWVGLIELSLLGLLLAGQFGWIGAHSDLSSEGLPWALVNHAMALLGMMLAVLMYHLLHALQMKELAQRTQELQRTHRALEQAQAHKDEFVAAVGHELRTPMNAILGLNGVLQAELADRPEQLEVVEHIRRSTEHLLQVVNEILDFSQLQVGKVQLMPHDLDLHATLRELAAKYETLARDKGLEWALLGLTDVPQHVHMDRQRLRQVMALLLSNAIKFTATGHVHLRVAQRGSCLRCEVSDTGCGIAPERQAHIFRRFEHVDVQTNRAHGGTGLGLSICEQLVLLHGGQIGVHSVPGQGSTFWFEVPWQAAVALPHLGAEVRPSDLPAPLNILVVDDNVLNLQVTELQIRKIWPQARVTTASGAGQALQWLAQQSFDLALVDRVMPQMDGPALTREIHQRFAATVTQMPIIALSADTQAQERERCLAAGMVAVLDKPIELQELERVVCAQLQHRRGRT
ncbi:MAG: response regulator [Betaproteobacteria bacterium]|nr:response regulator [Betaproteobacteria bacterium]